ncbi:SIR2 family protein [Halopseudomonas pachastrellae]|uniref:SIR2 family protein n=1 Tax=Halopseudomonas pachastrellae TaxID=254161 RepID=UPI003D7CD885
MKFHPDGPSIPDILLERCDAGRVVFLCGAGVSLPSGMPTFVGLTRHVIEFYDPPADSEVMVAFQPWLDDQSPAATNVPLDQIFNLLHLEYGKNEVNALVTERLSASLTKTGFGCEHRLLKRISSSQSGLPQIVTTNFDRLFEVDQNGEELAVHVPPAFPDLNFGSKIEGITYLHGRLAEATAETHPYVLSSADFGRAYLSEGWATNFIRHLLERYTVVLVGYQAEDPPIKYLLQGLNHDGEYDRSRLYAFDRGLPEEIEAKWRDRGVTAIAYSDHAELWNSMKAWAERADDPRKWRASVIAKCQQDPKDLAPHERGQAAHVLRSVQGAKLFAEADPAAHPEWVCVLDANVRSVNQSSDYGEDKEGFDPRVAYGLDDDLHDSSKDYSRQGGSNDNLLVWRDEDDNPHESHRLGGRQPEGFEATPIRLGHFITWLSRSIDSPVLAWWAIRQNGLHPRLQNQLEWQVEHSNALHSTARHVWQLILEYHRDPGNRPWDGNWFGFKTRIKTEGWTARVLREFRRISTPRLEIKRPFGEGKVRPPSVPWEEIHFRDLGEWDVVFLERHNDDLEVPDELLPQVVRILEEQLATASGLLGDIETLYFQTPTCYPGRDVEGEEHFTNAEEVVSWFVSLFDRMAATSPKLAYAHATAWSVTDIFYFRKLKLYAFNKAAVFEANNVAADLLILDQEAFWDTYVVRELLFLIVDRWEDFSQENRNRLTDRILAGPDRRPHWSNEEFPALRDCAASRYARYLELQGCEMTVDRKERLAEMISVIPGWRDSWATSMVAKRGARSGWVGTDEKPDALIDLPVNEVVSRAKEDLNRDFDSFIEKRPFTGLVKANPRKALSALTIAGRAGDYPKVFWEPLINEFPTDVSPRLRRVFLNRVTRLPPAVVSGLSQALSRWLEMNLVTTLEFDDELGWAAYDHIVNGVLKSGTEASKSGLAEIRHGGKVIQQSRRTLHHAINGPVGRCTEALFLAVPGNKPAAGSLIPDHIKSRLNRLLTEPSEGSAHAVSIASRKLNWLIFVDPTWTQECLIPMLAFDHPSSEPAWSGLFHSGRQPSPSLAMIIKPLLLELFPRITGLSGERDFSSLAAQWLGYMRVFHPNEPSGLSQGEMRSVLRAMPDDTRNSFISWLGRVGQRNENGWVERVIPLVSQDWPRERRYRTSASVRAWVGLLDDTGDEFPAVYDTVKKLLVPVETNDQSYYRFTRELSDQEPITALFPETTLDLMDRVTPQVLTRPSYQLPKVLAIIAETDPDLTSDPRYLRLIDLIERS